MPGNFPGSDDQNAPDTTVPRPTDQSPELTLTQIFTVLADRRRRAILDCFRQSGEVVAHSDLVDHVVACEPASETPEESREQLSIDIHHNHLPRLIDLGLVEHDDRSTAVRYYGHPLLEAILEAATEGEGEGESETGNETDTVSENDQECDQHQQ